MTGSYGNVTVGQLAGGAIDLPVDRRVASTAFRYLMPAWASQGPDVWYLVKVAISVGFAPDSGSGSVLVSALTNGRAGAQVEFFVDRRPGEGQVATWNSVDLIHGTSEGRFRGSGGTVKYRNFLQFKGGVQPGRNELVLKAQTFGDAEVKEIEFGPETGIYATPAGPADLEIEGEFVQDELAVGEVGRLEVTVTNSGSRSEEDVELTLRPLTDHLFTASPVTRKVEILKGSATRQFALGRSRSGDLRVLVSAHGASESEVTEKAFSVTVGDSDTKGSNWPWAALIGALVASLATLSLLRRKGRR